MDETRFFDDFQAARTNTYRNVLEAVQGIQPFEQSGRRLELLDAGYDDPDDDQDGEAWSPAAQALAVREKQTLGRRLRGTFRMTDLATGQFEDSKKLLAIVPRINEDGTVIYRGSKYGFMNQQRLKPGLFARVKKNNDYEVYGNIQKGTGSSHRYIFDAAKGQFYLNAGNSKIPLAPLLRIMGTTDDELKAAWGEELAKKNQDRGDSRTIDKLYEKLVPRRIRQQADPAVDKEQMIREAVMASRIDRETTVKNLGIDSDHLTGPVILRSTQKVLDMLRGEQDGDDRDAISNQTIHSVEDFLAERIKLDSGFEQRNSFRKALYRGSLKDLPPKVLQRQLEASLFGSGLAIQPEYANPLNSWDIATRITKTGDGGIGSIDAIPMESREFHGSHQGFIDPSRTSENLKVGADLSVTAPVRKGRDGKIYAPLVNNRTGELQYFTAEQIEKLTVAPSLEEAVPGYLIGVRNGKEDYYRPDEIEYSLPDTEAAFSTLANLIPLKLHQPHNRTAMGSRFVGQAVPLVNPEAPLVRSAVPGTDGKKSFETLYRERVGVVASRQPGVVEAVEPDRIVVQHTGPDGAPIKKNYWLHRHTPLGSKTALINTPMVQVGQAVESGDMLARSNFSDQKGDIALGANARIAIMPWRDNFEDAYTISESFAKRLSSHQSYDYRREREPDAVTDRNRFISVLPGQYNKQQLASLDPDGVIKVGTRVSSGDPLVLAAGRRPVNLSKAMTRSGHRAYTDQSQTWEHDVDGVVVGVHRSKSGAAVVTVDTESPMQQADKLAEVYGSKGVVSIIPDDQMVRDQDGKPFDVVSSDLGFISRKNASRAIALLLGKVAARTGVPYYLQEGSGQDMIEFVKQELKKNQMSATEEVEDPISGRKIPGVLTGVHHMMKLSHMSESKSQARGTGLYASDGTPAKGAEEGQQAKRISNQELGALVGHGAMRYLSEIATIKSNKNDEWAARYQSGQDLPTVKVPFVYEKFLAYLQGMGVNPIRSGSVTRLNLMNDQDIDRLAGDREVTKPDTVMLHRDMKPIKGGLFDASIFGDDGKLFAKYRLSEPIPHPLLQRPIMKLMDVTEKQYRDILSGKESFRDYGSGPKAINEFLTRLDPEREMANLRARIPGAAVTTKDKMVKQLRYLDAITKHKLTPEQLMLSRVPIIPPIYRPVSKLAGKSSTLIDGMNLLYQQMMTADQNLKELSSMSDDVSQERLAVYDAVRSAFGTTEPQDPELQRKNVSGLMKRITGPRGPKTSLAQSKLLSSTVDHVGRGVVLPNANLNLDEIGIPEEQAWGMFRLPVMRRLTRRNIPVQVAKQMLDNRTPQAREALLAEMKERPVTTSRAPVLHKFGLMGFMPKLVSGHALQVNPLIHQPLGLDHDGDAMNFHAVITDEAAQEVKDRMLPSRNLRSVVDFRSPLYQPRQDNLLGLFLASTRRQDRRPEVFATMQDAVKAFRAGKIGYDTPVKIMSRK